MSQQIIVAIIILACAAGLLLHFRKSVKSKSCACCGSSSRPSKSSCGCSCGCGGKK